MLGAWLVIRNGKSYRGNSLAEAQVMADTDTGGDVIDTSDATMESD